ncbi:MAG: 50S ribosomal protein L9 [Saprospiraceae bacterium]
MQIILLENIEKVGAKHEVVKVKDGYGRNYLIPQGKAIIANKTNLARLDGLKRQAAKKDAAAVESLRTLIAQMPQGPLKLMAKAGESGRLFGSITAQHIVDKLSEFGFKADKRMIEMPEEVKELGAYKAVAKFHPEVVLDIDFEVVAE